MTATDSAARRFASACGVLSQYVRASGAAALGVEAAGQEPGSPDAQQQQQLTIFYGGRVVVLDACTPAMAAELIRFATAAAASHGAKLVAQPPAPALLDMPIARKASLQRFLSKRKHRSSSTCVRREEPEEEEAVAPLPSPAKKGRTEASSWLALGSLGDMHAK